MLEIVLAAVKHWNRHPECLESPSQAIFTTELDKTLNN